MLRPSSLLAFLVVCICLLWGTAEASLGDRLPEFRECVEVRFFACVCAVSSVQKVQLCLGGWYYLAKVPGWLPTKAS